MHRARGLVGVLLAAMSAAVGAGAQAQVAGAGSFAEISLPAGFSGGVDTEPSLRVGPDGTSYIGAIRGVPSGIDLWKVPAGAASATYLGSPDSLAPGGTVCCLAAGGGDMDLSVNNDGTIGILSLWLGSVTVGQSTDGGQSFVAQPLGSPIPGVDRPWSATDGSNMYMSFHDVATGNIDVLKSPAGATVGLAYVPAGQVFSAGDPALNDNELGNLVADRFHPGVLYQVFTEPSAGGGSTISIGGSGGPQNQIRVAVSSNGGAAWTQHVVYTGPATANYSSIFPAMAEDHAGNLYVVASDNTHVYVFSSTDGGSTWSAPADVNTSGSAAVFPWIAAGGAGGVVVTWYQGTTTDPASTANTWTVQAAESVNASSAAPTYAVSQVSSGTVRQGEICESGLGCSSGRELGDFFQVAVGPDGLADFAWVNDGSSGGAPGDYFGHGGISLGPP